MFSRERISAVLENTGFDNLLKTVREEDPEPEVRRVPPAEETPQGKPDEKPAPEQEKPEEIIQTLPVEELAQDEPEEGPETEEPLVDRKLRTSILFFVTVDDSGAISLQHVSRPVYYEASPLTRTMEALLNGLTSAELNSGLLSLIPEGTAIRSVSVKNGVAYIDFTEAFAFNEFGAEGSNAALKQVVYTATEFSTVNAVQITINGKKRDFLITEGIPTATPLTRESF